MAMLPTIANKVLSAVVIDWLTTNCCLARFTK